MMRPFTLICMVMAGGSGLYLYQCKHQAQVLDREIVRTLKQTEATRERIGMLRAEWALLNEPDRLAELARAHTTLQTLQPVQFVAMNDLAARLPPPVAPGSPPAPEQPDPAAVAAADPPPAQAEAAPAQLANLAPAPAVAVPEPKPVLAAAEPKPAPVRHPPRPAPAQVAAAAPAHASPRPRPAPNVVPVAVSAEATAPGTVGAAVLRAMRHAAPAYVRPAYAPSPAYAPAPAYAPMASYPAPAVGSLLGGTRGALPPPVPFAAR